MGNAGSRTWIRHYSVSILLVATTLAIAQGDAPDVKGKTSIGEALAALTTGVGVQDAALSGTAVWALGSTQETGTATMKVRGASEARIDLALSNGSRTEVQYESAGKPAGQWMDPAGSVHSLALHNSFTPAAWFLPSAFLAVVDQPGVSTIWVSAEVRGGVAADHIRISRSFPAKDAATAALMSHLSTFDVYLDSSSHLPVALTFNLHPETNADRDLLCEIQFADYRQVHGVLVPFHVQRLIEGSINLDITLQDVAFNEGISSAEFERH